MLIISTGSNIGEKKNYLIEAKKKLSTHFILVAESSIYRSQAVDYLDQPDFLNQVLQFETPKITKEKTILLLLRLEKEMGRMRDISKGPRTIDLDIIFWGLESYNSDQLTIPHPAWRERSFIVIPTLELPYSKKLQEKFLFPTSFKNSAHKI